MDERMRMTVVDEDDCGGWEICKRVAMKHPHWLMKNTWLPVFLVWNKTEKIVMTNKSVRIQFTNYIDVIDYRITDYSFKNYSYFLCHSYWGRVSLGVTNLLVRWVEASIEHKGKLMTCTAVRSACVCLCNKRIHNHLTINFFHTYLQTYKQKHTQRYLTEEEHFGLILYKYPFFFWVAYGV